MKKIVVLFFFTYISNIIVSQSKITDGSFEVIKPGLSISLLEPQAQLQKSLYWKTRDGIQEGCFAKYLHSPDWVPGYSQCGGRIPYDGQRFVRAGDGNFELFYQNLNSIGGGKYIINAVVSLENDPIICPFNALPSGYIGRIGFNFRGCEYKFKNETSIDCNGGGCDEDYRTFTNCNKSYKSLFTFDASLLQGSKKWFPIKIPIDGDFSDMKWFGVLVGDGRTDCQGYMITYIDDISITRPQCFCPKEDWIENIVYNSIDKVQVSDMIISGKSVNLATTDGVVSVNSGATVNYSAGNQIILEDGFSAEAGSTFIAEIKPCSFPSGSGLAIDAKPTAFDPSATNINSRTISFHISNGTNYTAYILNRWGEIFTFYGEVPSDGWCRVPNIWPYVCWDGVTLTVVAENCSQTITQSWGVMPACGAAGKKDFEETAFKNDFSLYPNPAKDDFYIQSLKDNIKSIEVVNAIGQVIKLSPIESSKENTFKFNRMNLIDGVYVVFGFDEFNNKNFIGKLTLQ